MFSKELNFALLLHLVLWVRSDVLQTDEAMNGADNSLNTKYSKNESVVSYGELGSFRKRFLLPQSPEKINIVYYLYTPENRYVPNVLKYNFAKKEIQASNFNSTKHTKFVIHGFESSFNVMEWMGDIKDLIFALGDGKYNVIGLDWSQGADTIDYIRAISNTEVVGAATAHFIKNLVEYTGVNIEDIHLIGHSLGAQICGFIGKRFRDRKIGYITGLDPAGPGFYEDIPESRLDRTDAKIVAAIHTDSGTDLFQGFGLWDTVGIDDFYPNSGNHQPGCGFSKIFFNIMSEGITHGVVDTFTCNHKRAWVLFTVDPNTMDENCHYVGYECESWDKFIQGECADCGAEPQQEKCGLFNVFGPNDPTYGKLYSQHMNRMNAVDTKNRRLYFKTSEHPPFCLHHYQIVIHFAEDMPQDAKGSIKLSFHTNRRNVYDYPFGGGVKTYKAAMNATYLATWDKSIGQVHAIDLEWKSGHYWSFWSKKVPIHVKKIEMNYMSNFNPGIRRKLSETLCPQSGPIVNSGATAFFGICGNTDIKEESVTSVQN